MSTLTFPQLSTGALAQFPVRKNVRRRTVVNRAAGESMTKMSDPEGELVSWDLSYSGLTDLEMTAFEALFEACEGRLRSFVFIDPLGNLLKWSQDFSQTVWQTGLALEPGADDPVGGANATRIANGAQAPQAVSQTVPATGLYAYTFGVWVRSESATSVVLSISDVAGTRTVSPSWGYLSVGMPAGTAGEQVMCSIEVPGGQAVEIYGPQLDAQAGGSDYRCTTDESAWCRARFDQDELERNSHGPDNHSTRIRVLKVQE